MPDTFLEKKGQKSRASLGEAWHDLVPHNTATDVQEGAAEYYIGIAQPCESRALRKVERYAERADVLLDIPGWTDKIYWQLKR